MTSRVQWLAFGGVLICVCALQKEVNSGVISHVQETKVLGQGNVSVSASTLENASVMPLVSVEKEQHNASSDDQQDGQGIDERLFYSPTEAQAKTEPVPAVVVKPAVNVSLELAAAVKLEAVLTGGAIINGRFYAKGDVIATVKNSEGEPTGAKLIYIGADHVIVGAAGITKKVSI